MFLQFLYIFTQFYIMFFISRTLFTFKMLFITSILFHSNQSFFYIDQLAVLQCVLYGMYQIYKKIDYTFYQAINVYYIMFYRYYNIILLWLYIQMLLL